jgi:hypothetical protein
MRVPTRNTGTDHSVVARKGSNVPGAKGVGYSAGFRGQPRSAGEEPVKKAKPFEISKRVVVEAWEQVKANQ